MGLIETMRVREGRLPWLERHLARLRTSVAALDIAPPPEDLADPVRAGAPSGDGVVRLELSDGQVRIATRDVNVEQRVAIVVSRESHQPYPHKTTQREQFGRALAAARRTGAQDALLVTPDGYVAEGTAWNLFWWDGAALCTPAAGLGILPGIGRRRITELADVREEQVPRVALLGRSLFLVNAVRGIVEIGSLDGLPVPRDARTTELAASFWPD